MANNVQVPESWFRTLFVEQLNFDTSCRVFDQILLDGDSFIFRTCSSYFSFSLVFGKD